MEYEDSENTIYRAKEFIENVYKVVPFDMLDEDYFKDYFIPQMTEMLAGFFVSHEENFDENIKKFILRTLKVDENGEPNNE